MKYFTTILLLFSFMMGYSQNTAISEAENLIAIKNYKSAYKVLQSAAVYRYPWTLKFKAEATPAHRLPTQGRHAQRVGRPHPLQMLSAQGIKTHWPTLQS